MQSRKEYLYGLGLIPEIGRGRLSEDNKKVIEAAYAKGERFRDWEPTGPVKNAPKAVSSKPRKAIERKPKEEKPSGIYDIHIPFPEDEYVAYERRDGKRHYRSMRSACNNCRVSLVACYCFVSGKPARIVKEDGSGSVEVFLDRK